MGCTLDILNSGKDVGTMTSGNPIQTERVNNKSHTLNMHLPQFTIVYKYSLNFFNSKFFCALR